MGKHHGPYYSSVNMMSNMMMCQGMVDIMICDAFLYCHSVNSR